MPASIEQIVQKYAPVLLFERGEMHFPGKPSEFQELSRFRQSNYKETKDRGWNKNKNAWEEGNEYGEEYKNAGWLKIVEEIKNLTKVLRIWPPSYCEKVTRPRDERNLWRSEDNKRGFFLELVPQSSHYRSGTDPENPVPIFYDFHNESIENERGQSRDWVVLYYWFFYIYNYHILFAHEGDWEHISLYFTREDFEAGNKPQYIFFAAHNKGYLEPTFSKDSKIEWTLDTHPHVYVSMWGHPSYPKVPETRKKNFRVRWETWKLSIPEITQQEWHLYDGAWGEVGETVHSTGPLGPYFKRGRNMVKLLKRR